MSLKDFKMKDKKLKLKRVNLVQSSYEKVRIISIDCVCVCVCEKEGGREMYRHAETPYRQRVCVTM